MMEKIANTAAAHRIKTVRRRLQRARFCNREMTVQTKPVKATQQRAISFHAGRENADD